MFFFKLLISIVAGLLGPYFMWRGKKNSDLKMILWGAALLVLSYVVFSGGGDKDDAITKNALKSMMPQATEQIPQ